MAQSTLVDRVRRWALAAACAPLALLAGCPQSQVATAGKTPAQATAPALGNGPAQTAAGASSGTGPSGTTQAAEDPAHAAKVQALIDKAEASYRSGVADYRAGHLDAARLDFDAAVDVMLTSGMDLKNDPQLSDEFDRLLSAVNSLEMAALKQGNGFSQPIEAAPLDDANDVTFPSDAALKARLSAELKTTQSDFPLVVNDYVAGFINYFSNSPAGHAHLLRSLERAGKYKDMISKDLREAGVPQDLMYLAVAESGFQPQALNARSGAGGMWQFMPFAGAYGLTRNGWFDERFDPEKSSKAYARYMKYLYSQFGDWYLAMAAYDWGPGYVQRAVMKTGYADFWELYKRGVLPSETKNYVPGIIAAIIMAKNPAQYGLDKLAPDPPVVFDTVTVDYSIDLRLVADLTNSTPADIVALNPSLLRTTTPKDIPFDLHIPVGTHDIFAQRLKSIPEDKRATWRFHVVRNGETLDGIAQALHSHVQEIASANGLSAGGAVETGDELVIPVVTAAARPRTQYYTTRHGDTLVTVADRYGVSVEDLRRWNHLSSNAMRPGRKIAVSEPVRMAPVTHVRSRSSSGRSRTERSSAHTETKRSGASAHDSSSSAKKSTSAKKKKTASKTK